VISPYVRRLRLARELIALRESAKFTHARLAKATGESAAKISRLENGHIRPRLDDILKILDALGVTDGEQWTRLVTIAREAAERGWWDGSDIDNRQALYADLEAGAATIREYQQTIVPGLLQTEEFTRTIAVTDDLTLGTAPATPDSVSRARAGRQRMLRRPGGPSYEVILDEVVVRRPTAPAQVRAAQLRRLTELGASTTLQVLPVDAEIEAHTVPRSPFSLYTYRDANDPVIAAVDTVTSDLVLTAENQIDPYETLWARLREAALSPTDSAAFIAKVADEIN
jgi:transcriptional regulator with XRE-family HTH domain